MVWVPSGVSVTLRPSLAGCSSLKFARRGQNFFFSTLRLGRGSKSQPRRSWGPGYTSHVFQSSGFANQLSIVGPAQNVDCLKTETPENIVYRRQSWTCRLIANATKWLMQTQATSLRHITQVREDQTCPMCGAELAGLGWLLHGRCTQNTLHHLFLAKDPIG